MTNSDFRFAVGERWQSIRIQPGPKMIPTKGKSAAPAILYMEAFHNAVFTELAAVQDEKIVNFGITPTRSEF